MQACLDEANLFDLDLQFFVLDAEEFNVVLHFFILEALETTCIVLGSVLNFIKVVLELNTVLPEICDQGFKLFDFWVLLQIGLTLADDVLHKLIVIIIVDEASQVVDSSLSEPLLVNEEEVSFRYVLD